MEMLLQCKQLRTLAGAWIVAIQTQLRAERNRRRIGECQHHRVAHGGHLSDLVACACSVPMTGTDDAPKSVRSFAEKRLRFFE